MALVAGIDIGGTNMTASLVDDGHQLVERVKHKTPTEGPDAVMKAVVEMVKGLDERPLAVGLGIPGPVNDGVVTNPPNLQNWPSHVDLGEQMSRMLAVPVAVGNDANVGALGEWVAGAGRGSRFLLGVWMGTGVGGGLVLDGRPYTGASGGAGEFGHMVVQMNGARCGCGRRGCIEAYAGRASMERSVDLAVAAGRETTLLEIREERGKDRLTSSVWEKAIEEGDDLATELLDEAIAAISVGIGATINLLDLDRVVLGGGFAEKFGQQLADRVAETARPWVLLPRDGLDVVTAELGDDSGVVGAAALARAALLLQ